MAETLVSWLSGLMRWGDGNVRRVLREWATRVSGSTKVNPRLYSYSSSARLLGSDVKSFRNNRGDNIYLTIRSNLVTKVCPTINWMITLTRTLQSELLHLERTGRRRQGTMFHRWLLRQGCKAFRQADPATAFSLFFSRNFFALYLRDLW